jgi:hypothetical protein
MVSLVEQYVEEELSRYVEIVRNANQISENITGEEEDEHEV